MAAAIRPRVGARFCRRVSRHLSSGNAFQMVFASTTGAPSMNEAANSQPPFADFLGLKITLVSPERVTAELPVRQDLNNRFNIMHGGAIMALADNLGGTATTANLKDGESTTTIESKTNFFAAIPIGDVAYAECTPLHRGRTTMVWQTRITRGDGRLCALVTQTQLVMQRGKS
jgi:1,4-dihydroxy-2-naphthoyl-CoA hydrolase